MGSGRERIDRALVPGCGRNSLDAHPEQKRLCAKIGLGVCHSCVQRSDLRSISHALGHPKRLFGSQLHRPRTVQSATAVHPCNPGSRRRPFRSPIQRSAEKDCGPRHSYPRIYDLFRFCGIGNHWRGHHHRHQLANSWETVHRHTHATRNQLLQQLDAAPCHPCCISHCAGAGFVLEQTLSGKPCRRTSKIVWDLRSSDSCSDLCRQCHQLRGYRISVFRLFCLLR